MAGGDAAAMQLIIALFKMFFGFPLLFLVAIVILGDPAAFFRATWPYLLGAFVLFAAFLTNSLMDLSARAGVYRAEFEDEQLRRAEIRARMMVTSMLSPSYIPGRSLVARGTVTHRRRARSSPPWQAPPTLSIVAQHAPLPTGGPYAQVLRAAATSGVAHGAASRR